ncbi:transglycosylase family protein [Streptomyces sp. ACA25]|uniref:peptidoglycan DD-metalloendopeptidase family protein n=1 Tax=Streptomyces sp. ACA25 TaxID=3022596 RepID=UPI002306E928|nr:peptidoglycan DD-metalloendopeptidase family protein [Streptomyces sp. ACA25]MDB1089795.1 transglycosylase family protein [Streptomyces sp. ACA25]
MATGRHRRYKPGPVSRASLSVTAGGAGLALPLISALSANAAPVEVWNKVAECESNQSWDINTGNGYFGGLQFRQSTWEEFGGTAFAGRADLATKDQQIAVAEEVLKGQGPRAWPTCSARAGLVQEKPGGLTPDAGPKQPVEEQSGKPAAEPAGREDAGGGSPSHEVISGDSLSRIADQHGVRGGWQSLYELNRSTVGSDPDLILPGQRLALRAAEGQPKAAAPAEKKEDKKAKAEKAPAEKPAQPPKAEKAAQAEKAPVAEKAAAAPVAAPSYTAPVGVGTGTAYRTTGSNWSKGYHTGVDFAVPTGTTVKSVAGGKVISAGWAGSFGYEVIVRHSDGKYSQYAHLSAISVSAGQPVSTGQRVGRSGNTGNSTGPHLHFEIRTAPGFGSDIDPVGYLRAQGVSL